VFRRGVHRIPWLVNERPQARRRPSAASSCFRLERFAGWDLHPLESATLPRCTPGTDIGIISSMAIATAVSGHMESSLNACVRIVKNGKLKWAAPDGAADQGGVTLGAPGGSFFLDARDAFAR
jgi:hypothetical protein